MDIMLTEQDRKEVLHQYPTLNCSLPRQLIWGTLGFGCSFGSKTQEIVHDNSFANYIEDCYEVRINFKLKDRFGFPMVFEDSEIIKNFADSNNIELNDLHVTPEENNCCCLGVFPEYQWIGAAPFIGDKIIPFFYWQSHRRIYGKEPWKGYSHGNDGLIEAMTLPPNDAFKGTNRNKSCPCGSGQKYKKCCLRRDTIINSKRGNA
jgi:hypothetical protein